MDRVLVVGNGAREHAIVKALHRSDAQICAYMNKNNPGIVTLAKLGTQIGNLSDFEQIKNFATQMEINFVIVGPEAPLTQGITDYLAKYNIPVIGPTKKCAQLESSKIFTRNLLQKYNSSINIEFAVLSDMKQIENFVAQIGKENVVIKPDGLTGGKGVRVWGDHFQNLTEIYEYAKELLDKDGSLIIEEKLVGEEFTLMCFVDGKNVCPMPVVQDHKRAYEGDKGPNTGGGWGPIPCQITFYLL